MTSSWRIICAEVFAFAALCAFLAASRKWRQFVGTRAPVADKLLRPPGESLNQKILSLDEKIAVCIALAIGGPAVLAFETQALPLTTFLWLLLLTVTLCLFPVCVAAAKRRRYALGYLGERVVGETLNQLLRDGCHIFHDYHLPDRDWNIDHVIVAPSGVYVVETKARSKRSVSKGASATEVVFDGERLLFPNGYDTKAFEQARRNAADLSRELTSATGEPVKVKSILTFPGWFVTRKGRGDVNVLNPKEIRSAVLDPREPQLSAAQMQRIVHQLEQKCRDVEL